MFRWGLTHLQVAGNGPIYVDVMVLDGVSAKAVSCLADGTRRETNHHGRLRTGGFVRSGRSNVKWRRFRMFVCAAVVV